MEPTSALAWGVFPWRASSSNPAWAECNSIAVELTKKGLHKTGCTSNIRQPH